jgi:hypothetical protein
MTNNGFRYNSSHSTVFIRHFKRKIDETSDMFYLKNIHHRCWTLLNHPERLFLKTLKIGVKNDTLCHFKKDFYQQKNLDNKFKRCLNEASRIIFLMEKGKVRGRCFRHLPAPTKNESYIG